MKSNNIHRATSPDGTEIIGRAHGSGPPLVLVHGGGGDGEVSWQFLLPYLMDRYTCYAMSTRGRGLSADSSPPDHSIDRLVEDVVAFSKSIGAQVGAVGHSSSITLAAAARSDAISAIAVYEPGVASVLRNGTTHLESAVGKMMVTAEDGRHTEAARIFFEESGLFNGDELAAMAANGMYETTAPNVPSWCKELPEYAAATSESILADITVPVLLLRGSRTNHWFEESIQYIARNLADSRVAEVAGAGHMGPALVPEGVAVELDRFFSQVHYQESN